MSADGAGTCGAGARRGPRAGPNGRIMT